MISLPSRHAVWLMLCSILAVALGLSLVLGSRIVELEDSFREVSSQRYTARRLLALPAGLDGRPAVCASARGLPLDPNWRWDWRNLLVLVLSTINSFTAGATGQGGTALLVPIFTAPFLLGLTTQLAVAISAFVVFLGSVTSVPIAMSQRHPNHPERPLVDYAFLTFVVPPLLAGVRIGVFVNRLAPNWAIAFALILCYSAATYKALKVPLRSPRATQGWMPRHCVRAGTLRLWRKETALAQALKRVEEKVALLETTNSQLPESVSMTEYSTIEEQDSSALSQAHPPVARLQAMTLAHTTALNHLTEILQDVAALSDQVAAAEVATCSTLVMQCSGAAVMNGAALNALKAAAVTRLSGGSTRRSGGCCPPSGNAAAPTLMSSGSASLSRSLSASLLHRTATVRDILQRVAEVEDERVQGPLREMASRCCCTSPSPDGRKTGVDAAPTKHPALTGAAQRQLSLTTAAADQSALVPTVQSDSGVRGCGCSSMAPSDQLDSEARSSVRATPAASSLAKHGDAGAVLMEEGAGMALRTLSSDAKMSLTHPVEPPLPPRKPSAWEQVLAVCQPRTVAGSVAAWWGIQPKLAIGLVLATFLLNIVLSVMAARSNSCSVRYWAITGAMFGSLAVLLVIASWLQLRQIRRRRCATYNDGSTPTNTTVAKSAFASDVQQQQKQHTQEQSAKQVASKDIEWTESQLVYIPPLMVFVGVICGFVGASPNTLFLTPLLLSLGQHPKITSATLQVVLFMTSASTALGYLLMQRLVVSQGLAHGITGMICAPLGLLAVDLWVRRTGRASIIMVIGVVRNAVAIPLLAAFDGVAGVVDLICRYPLNLCGVPGYLTHNSWMFDADAACSSC